MVTQHNLAVIFCLMLTFNGLSACNHNDDSPEQRREAARQYLQVTSINTIVEGGIFEFAATIPAEQRAANVEKLRAAIRTDTVEKIAIEALVKTFTTNELKALTDFYGSEVGRSAVNKFGAYSAEVMPNIRKEIQRAAASSKDKM